jgi:predicted DNA-binding transcriptional regulator YafY
MAQLETISRFALIIKKLRKHPATFEQIEQFLERESELQGFNFKKSQRTFQRNIQEIKAAFNIHIQYDFSKKVYYIDYDANNQVSERMLEAFDTFNALSISDRLSPYISFEQRKPKGTENLNELMQAAKNQVQVSFAYQKYEEEDPSFRTAEPYALKESKNRWYLIAKDLKDSQIKSFGLDRISVLETTNTPFKIPEDFNVDKHFKFSFGVINDENLEPQEVILSFNPFQGKYIKSLPLHPTQEIMLDNEEECRVKLHIFITHDFFMELLSLGDNVKIITPKSLIKDLTYILKNVLKQYEN